MKSPLPAEGFPASGSLPLAQDGPITLPFSKGEVIAGKYEVIDLIGSGGMGYVISAMHLELGERVALKFLRQEALANPEIVGRFAHEARAAVRIKSEYVARTYDVGTLPGGNPFIVMEYLEGKDLADVLNQEGALPIKTAVEYVMQTCEALASAHANGIVHRDIKPENLFLTRHAQSVDIVKVLDFGISKGALTSGTAAARRDFAKTMLPMGSPAYMSPEQIRSSGEVDSRTDIWSLGCVLFELITGASVFSAPTLMQLSAAILEREPIKLRGYVPDAPPELELIILRCLEKDVTKRFQNVAELAVALFPFAPRRARISAERCSYLLRNADFPAEVFELSSISPPPFDVTDSATEILIKYDDDRGSNVPSAVSIVDADQNPFRPKGGRKRAAVVGVVALVAGAIGMAVWGGPDAGPPEAVPAAPIAAAKPEPLPKPPVTAAVTAAPIVAEPVNGPETNSVIAPPPVESETDTRARNKLGKTQSTLSKPRYPASRTKPRPTAAVRPGAPTPSHDDEPDVGY